MTFTNLHLHTTYSWDSVSDISKIVGFIKNDGQTACAITDHGNMSGAIEFFLACEAAKIKPIIGNEMYICADQKSATDKSSNNKALNHLVLLAKNYVGYQNLLKLTSLSNEFYYYRPRIDENLLAKYSEGIIAINGHIGTSIFDTLFFNLDGVNSCETIECAKEYLYPDYEDRFLEVATRYKKIFGDDFYIECQLFDPDDIVQQASGHLLRELAIKHGFKPVGTGDAHYITKDECEVHKTFVAIKQNTKVKFLPNMRYLHSGMYGIVTNEHAQKCYPPDLISATEEIVNKIEKFSILKKERVPKYSNNAFEELSNICFNRLTELNLDTPEYIQRLKYELEITKTGKLQDYFMIVADYINFAVNNGMLVGPGRGSSGGSLIAYLTKITGLDPIKYNLIFERFYSPDRAAYGDIPDVDTDFPTSGREKVIDYIRQKYGPDKVAGVVTFSTLQGKGAIKDVLRAWDVCSFQEMNAISDLIPSKDKISDKLADFKKSHGTESIIMYTLVTEPAALADYVVLDDEGNLHGEYAPYFKIAMQIEGAIKSESKHASAIIISDSPITEWAPLLRDKNSDNLICAYDMESFPKASGVKFDILALKSLDGLMEVNSLIREIGIDG